MLISDDQVIELTCTNCNTNIKQEVRWFKQDGNNCPGCGDALDGGQFRDFIEQATALARISLGASARSASNSFSTLNNSDLSTGCIVRIICLSIFFKFLLIKSKSHRGTLLPAGGNRNPTGSR